MQGYVKLFRSLLQWEWYQDQNTKALFLHLLLKACFRDSKYKGADIPRGSCAVTLQVLADELGMSVKSVRTALKHLQSTGEVAIDGAKPFSVVRIVNYCVFQEAEEEKGQTKGKRRADEGQTKGRQRADEGQTKGTAIEEEGKKVKREEKKYYGEFVRLSEQEYQSLQERVGKAGTKRCIEILDDYKGASGKQYRSDYRAMLSWVLARYEREPEKKERSYSMSDIEELMLFSPFDELP